MPNPMMQGRTYLLTMCLVLCTYLSVNAQDNSPYTFKREVSIDATSVIGNLLSLNSERATNPYGFGMRFHFKKWSLRLSGSTFYDDDEILEFNGNDFVRRLTTNHDHSLRVAFEKGIDVSNRFRLLYSIDLLTGYRSDNSSFGTSFNRYDQDFTVGVGPALRLEYRINDRFLLTTESTLYFESTYNVDSFKLGFDPRETENSLSYRAALSLPQSLIVSIGF